MNILEFLNGRQSLFLKSINYQINETFEQKEAIEVQVFDDLDSKFVEEKKIIEIVVKRKVQFVPIEPYALEVVMGSNLFLKEDKLQEFKQANLNLNEELVKQSKILSVLTSRISLLISQITASYGGKPMITPPIYVPENEN